MNPGKPLRVLHLLSGGTVGGCEHHVLSLTSRLDRRAFEPWVAFFQARPDAADPMAPAFEAAGVRTVDLGAERRLDPRAITRLGRLLTRRRFDLLHAHSLRAELAAVFWGKGLRRAPVVIRTVHNTDEFYTRRALAAMARVSSVALDRVVVISDAVGAFVRDKVGVPPGKISRIYYGLDANCWARPEPAAAGRPPTIGIVARLAPQKGHRVLLDAMPAVARQIPNVRLRVIGHEERSTVAELQAHAGRLGVAERVRFEGFRRDVADVLHQIDLFVLPSLWEGFGLVLLEAMAARRPVVASAVGPVPEIVLHGETGLLVSPGQPDELAEAIVRVLRDPVLARRFGQAGYERVRATFTVDRMVEQTQALYLGLCR